VIFFSPNRCTSVSQCSSHTWQRAGWGPMRRPYLEVMLHFLRRYCLLCKKQRVNQQAPLECCACVQILNITLVWDSPITHKALHRNNRPAGHGCRCVQTSAYLGVTFVISTQTNSASAATLGVYRRSFYQLPPVALVTVTSTCSFGGSAQQQPAASCSGCCSSCTPTGTG
jgi:hypothetical protein